MTPPLASTVDHSPRAHTKLGSSGLGCRPDTAHALAMETSLAVSGCESTSVSLPSKYQCPAWGPPRKLWGGQMNGCIQQYKLSTYCVQVHRQVLPWKCSVWWGEEDAQKGTDKPETSAKGRRVGGLHRGLPKEGFRKLNF